jgi:hypothetical protein
VQLPLSCFQDVGLRKDAHMVRKLLVLCLVVAAFALGKGWITIPNLSSRPAAPQPQTLMESLFPPPPPQPTWVDQGRAAVDKFIHSDTGLLLIALAGGLVAVVIIGKTSLD